MVIGPTDPGGSERLRVDGSALVNGDLDLNGNDIVDADRLQLNPLSSAPTATTGSVAYSDGTGGGFDGSSGAGLYVYKGASWTFIA